MRRKDATPLSPSQHEARAKMPALVALFVAGALMVAAVVSTPDLFGGSDSESPSPSPEVPMDVVGVEPHGDSSDVIVRQCVTPESPQSARARTTEPNVVCTDYVVMVSAGSDVQVGDQMVVTTA